MRLAVSSGIDQHGESTKSYVLCGLQSKHGIASTLQLYNLLQVDKFMIWYKKGDVSRETSPLISKIGSVEKNADFRD